MTLWLLVAFGLGFSVAIALLPWEEFGAPLLVLLLGMCGLIVWIWVDAGPQPKRPVLLIVGSALFLRTAAAALFSGWLGPQGLWNDAISYDRIGWALAQAWHLGSTNPARLGSLAYLALEPFSNVVGVIYFFLGHSPAAVVAFNCLLGAGTAYLTYCLAVLLAGQRVALLAGWLVALYSGFWVFSLMILKDGLTLFMLLFFVVSFYRLVFADRLGWTSLLWLALAVGCGLFLKGLRDYVWVLAGVTALLVVLARLSQVRRGRWAVALIGLVVVVSLMGVAPRLARIPITWASLGGGTFLASYLKELPPSGTVLDLLKWTRLHPLAFGEFAGLSVISSALAPYAWILPGSIPGALPFDAYTVSYPGMWMWYFLLPFSVIGAAVGLRRAPGKFLPVLALALLLFLLFALTIPRESRHRDMVMPVLLLLGAQGIVSGWQWRQWGWLFWGPLFLAAAIKIQALPSLAIATLGLAVLLWVLSLRGAGTQARVASA